MDFLDKATKKLDVQDKLPGQVKDKMPGQQERGKHAEGSHLAKSNERKDDDGDEGFPQGLRPSDWMGDLIAKKLVPETASVTDFRYPGSHDSATYGSGLESFSYQCQDKNLYDQMMVGQRAFDVRLAPGDKGKKFIPVHGMAKNTADDFNSGPKEADKNDLVTQIMRFAKEHHTEIIVLQMRVQDLLKEEVKKDFGDACFHLLGQRLLEAPQRGGRVPTYQEAVQQNRNIILGVSANFKEHPIEKYVWDVGGETACWMGDGNQMLWNEPTWQSGEIKKVLHSTEEFIDKNEQKTSQREKFWAAYLQLTPVLGQSIGTFLKEGGSVRPRDLALGGGMGSHGGFKGSNKELRDSGVLKQPKWKKNASLLLYDFADTKTAGHIVAMNIGADFPAEQGGAGVGAAEEHGGPGGGGRGGRGGMRGGRGGHDGASDRRDEDDEPGAGRGGHGGRGRGEHHGRGRGHD